MSIPVVDLFAGPGGLGEGFSALRDPVSQSRKFHIAVSAEMEFWAAQTLRLRAFFRQFEDGEVPRSYFEYLAGDRPVPWTEGTLSKWEDAAREARQLTLGNPGHDKELASQIRKSIDPDRPWVLIGGPPCQAYSLVGRARNRGVKGYIAETDERHFLYQHYLRVIEKFRPTIFVMENVKGILSSSVGGERVFEKILDDLRHAGGRRTTRYRLYSLVVAGEQLVPSDFVVRSEEYGVPQARHRVILVGVSEELGRKDAPSLKPRFQRATVRQAIGDLPEVRSGLTSGAVPDWALVAARILQQAAKRARPRDSAVSDLLGELSAQALDRSDPGPGGRWIHTSRPRAGTPPHLRKWLGDGRLHGVLNHEARSHMEEDLTRYAFSAAFAQLHHRSPRSEDFPKGLAPAHRNWGSGKFADRFKVQLFDQPGSTVTSHLAKDGHYFIHPDPLQLRSLTVREAARLQTFPDNYFFEGSKGAQFKQVGNAVPPWLALQIAGTVHDMLE